MISYKPFYETLLKKNITEYHLIFKEGISANTQYTTEDEKKENHGEIYSYMILSETLRKHLAEIDEKCNKMMDRLVRQMAKKESVTEQLKSDDWIGWLQKMNNIRSRAEEVVLHDLISSL